MELEERMRPPLSADFNREQRVTIKKSVDNSGRKSEHSLESRPIPNRKVTSLIYIMYISVTELFRQTD